MRDGANATGVNVSCSATSGFSGVVNLTPNAGRVIVSAGTFGTAKLLFRSKSCLMMLWKDFKNCD